MLLASCHGLSGSFSAFLLGASPPSSLGNREKKDLFSKPLSACPARISVLFTRRDDSRAAVTDCIPLPNTHTTHSIMLTTGHLAMATDLFLLL